MKQSPEPARANQPDPQSKPVPNPPLPRIIRVEELMGQHNEVLIACGNHLYRLRRTRQGKLLLYK